MTTGIRGGALGLSLLALVMMAGCQGGAGPAFEPEVSAPSTPHPVPGSGSRTAAPATSSAATTAETPTPTPDSKVTDSARGCVYTPVKVGEGAYLWDKVPTPSSQEDYAKQVRDPVDEATATIIRDRVTRWVDHLNTSDLGGLATDVGGEDLSGDHATVRAENEACFWEAGKTQWTVSEIEPFRGFMCSYCYGAWFVMTADNGRSVKAMKALTIRAAMSAEPVIMER